MGVQAGQPRPVQEGPYEPLARPGIPQRDPELRRRGGGGEGVDRARARLRVDPDPQRGRRGSLGDQCVQAFQFLPVVGVDGDSERQRLAQLGHGLGGGVQDRPLRLHPGRPGQRQLAGARDLAAEPAVREQPQHRHERARLHREGVQDGGAGRQRGREGAGQGGGGGSDPGHVQQADQGLRGIRPAHQTLLDGGPYGQVPARRGIRRARRRVRLDSHVRQPIIRRVGPQLLTESIQEVRM